MLLRVVFNCEWTFLWLFTHVRGFIIRRGLMTSSNEHIFRLTGPLCGEFNGHRWIPLTKASDAELLMFSLICTWINGWVNNCEAGDLRRNHAHYDVTAIYHRVAAIRPKRSHNVHASSRFVVKQFWSTSPISFRVTSLTPGQMHYCSNIGQSYLTNIGIWPTEIHQEQ